MVELKKRPPSWVRRHKGKLSAAVAIPMVLWLCAAAFWFAVGTTDTSTQRGYSPREFIRAAYGFEAISPPDTTPPLYFSNDPNGPAFRYLGTQSLAISGGGTRTVVQLAFRNRGSEQVVSLPSDRVVFEPLDSLPSAMAAVVKQHGPGFMAYALDSFADAAPRSPSTVAYGKRVWSGGLWQFWCFQCGATVQPPDITDTELWRLHFQPSAGNVASQANGLADTLGQLVLVGVSPPEQAPLVSGPAPSEQPTG